MNMIVKGKGWFSRWTRHRKPSLPGLDSELWTQSKAVFFQDFIRSMEGGMEMERTFRGNARINGRMARISLLSALAWGLVGGFAGTLVMDLVLMGAFSALGSPADDLLLDRREYRRSVFFTQRPGVGRQHSTGHPYPLSGWSADRRDLRCARGTRRCASGEYSEKKHHSGDSCTLRS